MIKLDKKDRALLLELDTNCRQSNSEIAKKLKLSKDTVNYRIKKLERQGIIEGHRAVIDMGKLGYKITRMYLKLQDTHKEIEEEIISYLCNIKKIFWVGKTAGRCNICFGYWALSNRDFYDFLIKFLTKYRKYIQEEEIANFVEFIHYRKAYVDNLKEDEGPPLIVGSEDVIQYDETDWKILSIISGKARIPLIELAKEVKLTPMAVKYRLNNLEKKKVIVGYKSLIDFRKFGYEYYKVDIFLEDISKIKEIETFCQYHPNITYLDRTYGGGDIEFDLEVKNLPHFIEIIDELKTKFKGVIRSFSFFSVLKIRKVLYFPI